MIRFLQTPGPIKKIVLGGILLVICVMMVITLIPGGGFLNDMFGGGVTQSGILARVGNQDVGLQDVSKQIKPTDAELKAFYEQNKQQYVNSIPEKRKARYILIDTAKLADKISLNQAQLQQYYSQHQDEYRIPETVTVRHILIKTPTPDADGKVDQKGVDAARTKADDIEKQLKSGANFGDLAKKYSEDPGSAQNGGLMPPIRRGRTVPEFEQAAFNTLVGQTTNVIRTNYGFHIIHVEAKQQARLKPFDEVKSQIEPLIKQQQVSSEAQSLANTVQTRARTVGFD